MNGNEVVKNLICSLDYDYKLGDMVLIEDAKKISTFLSRVFSEYQMGMDMVCGDCSGDVIKFVDSGYGDISFFTTDNGVEYQFNVKGLFIATNKDKTNMSPHIFLITSEKNLPANSRIRSYDRLNNLKYVTGVILQDGTRSFDCNLENKCFDSLENPNVDPIKFERIKNYSYDGVLVYMNIQGMDLAIDPFHNLGNYTIDTFRNDENVIK